MVEYPHIINSSKAPRDWCVAFDKIDGSNFRAKWTRKKGFNLFGTKTQLIDENTAFFGEMVTIFKKTWLDILHEKIKRDFSDEREVIFFGEYIGEHSFAGFHDKTEPHEIVAIDLLIGHKNKAFLKPRDFIKVIGPCGKIPRIIYEGNLNEQFINKVRQNEFELNEGVICRGVSTNGAYRGKVWMCKIKTYDYLNKIKLNFENTWSNYWE